MNIFQISKKMRKIRQNQGVTQERLAILSGISRNTVASIELATNKAPTLPTLAAIAKGLRCVLHVDFLPRGRQ